MQRDGRKSGSPSLLAKEGGGMVARKRTSKYLVIGSFLAFAVIISFLIGAGLSEAEHINSPIETPSAGILTPQETSAASATP